MKILGIETSCDETACAVVENGKKILSNVVFTQEKLHRPFKGIVPEIASRSHIEKINGVIERALLESKTGPDSLDGIAVTVGPGLIGSLLVGKMSAEAMAWVWNKPLVGVNHLEAHLFANLLERNEVRPPFLGLVVSGGHTDLILVKGYGDYQVLGRTRDDAAGECYDKASKILGLGYPGGPVIDRLAQAGNPQAVRFSRPYLPGSWDFSFSGLKTAVLYLWQKQKESVLCLKPSERRRFFADLCASFQATVVDTLVHKAMNAAHTYRLKNIVVGGGVAANSGLRDRFIQEGKKSGTKVYLPSREMCTDNAAMVAAAGYLKLKLQKKTESLKVNASLEITNWTG